MPRLGPSTTQRPARPGRREGFTLVELLVVVAIIVILLALSTPSFRGAIDKARRNGCQNNHHQMSSAVSSYAAANRSYLTFPNWLAPEVTKRPGTNEYYWNGKGWLYQVAQLKNGWGNFVLEDLQTGATWQYTQSYEIYRCPAERPPFDKGSSNHITSYLMNGAVVNFGHPRDQQVALFRTSDMIGFEAGQGVMIWEAQETWGAYWNDGSSTPNQGLTDRHGDGATVGCMDGSTDWIALKDYDYELSLRPGRLWCNPGAYDGRYQFIHPGGW